METTPNDYRISFFKPTTAIALYNRNLVVWLVCIWAVAVFGFQITLKLIEKPTPEPAYLAFESVWSQVETETAPASDLQTFAQTCLSVLGKNFIQPNEKAALDNGLTWALNQLIDPQQQANLKRQIIDFEGLRASISNITDPQYVAAKNQLSATLYPVLGIHPLDARTKLIATELVSSGLDGFSAVSKAAIPSVMTKYLIHNQSFLTDFKFLGFPFHYFYASIFLLILFVGLCLLYCIRIDRRNVILGIED